MRFKNIVCLFVFHFVSTLILIAQNESTATSIIPIPSAQTMENDSLILNHEIGIRYDETFKISANFLKEFLINGGDFKVKKGHTISFIKDKSISSPEGYQLSINPSGIVIKASTDQGAFYAVQSLRQLLPVELENSSFKGKSISVASISISDSPQFPYRGMHLDVSRHMFPMEFIKKYIDALAMLKLNTFHWHLTDDQGWRIEIKKYPKLQDIAAFRKETLIGHYNTDPQQFDGKRYGGYYSQEEIKELVAYAQKRFVTIIPEIEMPGHSQAAISAYPQLGCTGNSVDAATKWGVFDEVYCPKEETFVFLQNVLDEVLQLFPSKMIHIGGDEAPKTHWKNCDACQQKIKSLGLKDEHELQSYFISRIEKYLNGKGRDIIGWDEILEGGLAPNATVMSWRGISGAIEAAKQHHNVILTPNSHLYFDYYQSVKKNEPLAIGGYIPLEKVYNFNPIPKELSKEESKYVLGVQANLWTEYLPYEKDVEYMVFPRILALSEIAWSKPEYRDYDDFIQRVESFQKRLDILDINYANHLFEIEGNLTTNGYELKTLTKNKSIRYTLDGTEPNLNSTNYSEPIPILENKVIKAGVFNHSGQLGSTFSQIINYHNGVGKKINLNVSPHKAYPGSGAEGLINGISGSDTRYGDKEWLGFWGDDVIITIDLGSVTEINSIETRFYHAPGQWIYAPNQIELIFDDGEKKLISDISNSNKSINNIKLETSVSSRLIKLIVKNNGIIPDGKQGAGNKSWTFIDEIIIN